MKQSLESMCLNIVDCEHKTSPIDESGEFFAVGTPAMRGNVIDFGQARRISEETFKTWTRRMRPKFGDLLFAREAPVGPVVLIPREENVAAGQRTVLLRPDSRQLNTRFLYYLLSSPMQQKKIEALAAGSTVAHLNVSDVRSLEIQVPPIAEQQALADVLGALDDKIAANTKVSQTSNDLASALFRRALNNAEFSKDTFADLALVSGGGTPSTRNPDFWDGQVPWATPTDITALTGPYLEETSRAISDAGLKACASDLYPQGTILMTSRATIGAFSIAQKPTAVNQGFIVVQPYDPKTRYWIFHEMQSRVDEFISLANGATFLELSRGNFKKLKVRIAPPATMNEFNRRATALHETARMALVENTKLAETRDTLLSQLLSGKLRVKDAEALVESTV
ncbi:restriction endonuclease subunit S [Glutamicibacter arilaitensis]|uniref:restriction endonuclease subunit S n=1 Tax=Glutamicibacter arilaitensis TaxID=256701 RepID=UPI003F9270F7